ncbi:hypothetical protein OAM03_02390 [Verrucomicrobia bacterium]|nr:hypothetical protein [Verrucomicrobiota bacterium]|tara:strand:+ start:187 stop:453 length:267 start_codon:yes stop_codon:yes gene_type:complete
MKKLDWKSFVIGVLLTSTVILGTGAATRASENWDADQQWLIAEIPISEANPTKKGWEPISSAGDGLLIILRRPYDPIGGVNKYEDQQE